MISDIEIDTTLCRIIDHTLLKPDANESDVLRYCDEATTYGFCSVVVNPVHVRRVKERLSGSRVKTASVIGFPLGGSLADIKVRETERALSDGAEEIDVVIDIGALKDGRVDLVQSELLAIRQTTTGVTLKVIIEACLLSEQDKISACHICTFVGADFVKTSTGYSSGGATVADVALLRETVGPEFGVKASGGIRTRSDALAMVRAGATRIGTSVGPLLVSLSEGNPTA